MNDLRLIRCGAGAPAEVIPGGYILTAEVDWLVEGPTHEVAAVNEALPSGIAEKWGSTLRLRFRGTLVGRISAGPLGQLHVHSGKWTETHYDDMLADIARITQTLPFDAGAASALPYYRDPSLTADDIPYHAFVWLRHVLLDHPQRPLRGALEEILVKPHRRLVRDEREVPVELASALSARTLDDVLAGRWPLQRAPEGLGIRGHLPMRITNATSRESVDTPENRFVKAFLEACDRFVDTIQSRIDKAPATIRQRLSANCASLQAEITRFRHNALFRDIGPLTQMPAASTVLQRRAPYREVYRSHLLLRAASQVLPFSNAEIVQMLEVKNIARLYEIWCGFHLVELLTEYLGKPHHATITDGNAFGTTIRRHVEVHWPSGAALALNATYTPKKGFRGKSRSVDLRPDFALYLPSGPAPGLHLFDAKFRLKHKRNGAKASRVDDIHKMHTYRDAIAAAKSAWVLYPGTHRLCYLDERDSPVPLGVGAFPAVPGAASTYLAKHLRFLIGLPPVASSFSLSA